MHVSFSSSLAPSTAAAAADQAVDHADFFFSLISATGVPVRFRVTPYMCAHSLYLHSAREVAATDGVVPVGSTQAVRDYVTYMQYSDLREQLAAELARAPAVHHPGAAPGLVRTPAPLLEALAAGEEARVRDREGLYLSGAAAPPLWEDPGLIHAEGARGYVVRPLDCDRAYAEHAAHLRHWFTAAELSSLRGDASAGGGASAASTATAAAAAAATSVSGAGARPRSHPRSPASTASSSPPHAAAPASTHVLAGVAGPSPAEPLPPPAFPRVESGPRRGQGRPRPRRYSFMPSSASSSSSSVSSSPPSTPGPAPRGAQAAGSAAEGNKAAPSRPSLGDRRETGMCDTLGYSEYAALDMPDGVFFVEHVLLPERAPRVASASAETPATPPADRDGVDVSVRAAQQCRLLELIAVADFMGTQPLVELCATYLAAWLMDHTEEELVASFLAPASPGGAASGAASPVFNATRFQLTGATALSEPWIVPASSVGHDEAGLAAPASVSPTTAASGAAGGGSAKGGSATLAAAPAHAAKKKNGAAAAAASRQAGKQRGRAAGMGTAGPDAGGNAHVDDSAPVDGADLATETTTTTSAPPRLLSGDQRLALLRQMKRDNAIMVTPY